MFTRSKVLSVKFKRWVITFDPAVRFQPIVYQNDRLVDTFDFICYRLITDGRIKSYDSTFYVYLIKSFIGKIQTMSHNFWSGRQVLADSISNRPSRRYLQFHMLKAKNWRSDPKLWLIVLSLPDKILILTSVLDRIEKTLSKFLKIKVLNPSTW